MGGEMEEWMDTDSLLGSRDMEPALWSPTARAWRAAQPRHGGRDEHKPQRRGIGEIEAKREKVPCLCRQFSV